MTRKSLKSKSLRKNVQRLPGGRLKTASSRKKRSRLKCAVTGKPLSGVPRVKSSAVRRIEKSKRAPNRPYGGVLNPSVTKAMFIKKAREENA